MSKKKYLNICFELAFITIIIVGGLKQLEERRHSFNLESDEPAWIFSGYYFNLYFLHFDLFHQDWNDYEAFDQPPLAKYIIGGAIYLKGYRIDSIEPKRFWNNTPIDKLPIYFDLISSKIPNPGIVIPSTRSVVFLFALSSLLLIYTSIRILYGMLPALISTALIISNPIFNYYSSRILADPILLFFFALFVLFCALYWKSRKNMYVIFAFIASSLSFLTKLNGILLVPVLIIIFLIGNKCLISKKNLQVMIIGFMVFILICILLNPIFLNTGIKALWKMVEFRLVAFRTFQETFKGAALLSVSERFITSAKILFFKSCLFYPLVKVPVELIMFVAGIYYVITKRDVLLIAILVFLVIIPISLLPYSVPRYYYWILPFIHIVAGQSSNLVKEIWTRKIRVLCEKLD
jgi:4-amino-4-deoxy-L-arabinose transferase-like glycosyltransferase